jgi:hypothetical protein
MSAHHDLHVIQMAHENASSYQNPTSTVALEVESHPLSSKKISLGCGGVFSFFFLFSLSA